MGVVQLCFFSREKYVALPHIALCLYASRVVRVALVMTKWSKEGAGEMQYTSDLGKSIVTQLVLRTLIDEGKLKSLRR